MYGMAGLTAAGGFLVIKAGCSFKTEVKCNLVRINVQNNLSHNAFLDLLKLFPLSLPSLLLSQYH